MDGFVEQRSERAAEIQASLYDHRCVFWKQLLVLQKADLEILPTSGYHLVISAGKPNVCSALGSYSLPKWYLL